MILVFGRTGQVGRALAHLPDVRALGREEADLARPETCARAIRAHRPRAVINAAAFTAVDRAESAEAEARIVNAEAPGAMAGACAALGVPLVHLSTDYVFDGTGAAPFAPDHPPAPVNAYGRTKLAGERAVIASGATHAILRTSWVFSAHGANFVRTMLRLGRTRDSLRVVADQTGGPTPAAALAIACLRIAERLAAGEAPGGVYHLSGAPDVTWADFARAIMAEARLDCRIEPIASADYPTPARRPANSRLDCTGTEAVFGIARPDWRAALGPVVAALMEEPA